MKKPCYRCKEMIDLEKDNFVLLATYEGKNNKQNILFHFNCWRLHFEEKTREKAENIVKGMQKKIMPIAEGLFGRLKKQFEE